MARPVNLNQVVLVDDEIDVIDPTEAVKDSFAFLVEDPMQFDEFVGIYNALLTDDIRDPVDMLAFVDSYNVQEEADDENGETQTHIVSRKEASSALSTLLQFFEGSENFDLPEIVTLFKLQQKLDNERQANLRQSTIVDFLN